MSRARRLIERIEDRHTAPLPRHDGLQRQRKERRHLPQSSTNQTLASLTPAEPPHYRSKLDQWRVEGTALSGWSASQIWVPAGFACAARPRSARAPADMLSPAARRSNTVASGQGACNASEPSRVQTKRVCTSRQCRSLPVLPVADRPLGSNPAAIQPRNLTAVLAIRLLTCTSS
jgi:hypothetical protein